MMQPAAQDQVNNDQPGAYTMRQLNQLTAFVMDQIEKNGPALITRHGHFVAVITPLEGDVESLVLSAMARKIAKREPGTLSKRPD